MTATADLLKVYFEPIEELLRDGAVTNIHVNAWDEVFFDKRGATHRYGGSWRDEEELANAIHTLAASLQQDIDPRRPLLDARLPDGTRINAVLPPVSERPLPFDTGFSRNSPHRGGSGLVPRAAR